MILYTIQERSGVYMKKFLGKKQVLIAALTLALGLAVYLNYYFASENPSVAAGGKSSGDTAASTTTTRGNLGDSQFVNGPTSTTTAAPSGYFAQARASRSSARQEALELLQDTLNNVKATDAQKAEATKKLEAAAKAVEQEDAIESLIKAKGFADCVVYIEEANCHVVVQSEGLKPQETLQITEIVTAQSEVKAENIKIITAKS